MTKKKKIDTRGLKKVLPYAGAAILTLSIAALGSLNKQAANASLNLSALAETNYDKVSVAQLSGFYVVADIADALSLASASDVASNYVTVTSLYKTGQTSDGKIDKPTISNIIISRGVITHVVQAGDSVEALAAGYGVSSDQLRWSNGLKDTTISVGSVLYLPGSNAAPGIVYTVKSGDTLDLIASKYGSTVAEIISNNNLENSPLTEGMKIAIKGGSLPESERPEYVVPAPTYNYSYTYSGSVYARLNVRDAEYVYGLGGPYVAGQCTQWAWYNRQDLPSNLGNAYSWAARAAAQGFTVSDEPVAGAVFQTSVGRYGHVGYVEKVNADGSITVTEMNYSYRSFLVMRSEIPANVVHDFLYIWP